MICNSESQAEFIHNLKDFLANQDVEIYENSNGKLYLDSMQNGFSIPVRDVFSYLFLDNLMPKEDA